MGRSLGAAVALQLAADVELGRRCQGLILVAPFLSVVDILERYVSIFAHVMTDDAFPNNERMQRVKTPTLVIHGHDDMLVPYTQGQRLYELCQQRKEFICPEGMSHNSDILANAGYFLQPVLQFFALPDYSFNEMSVPAAAYDKRL